MNAYPLFVEPVPPARRGVLAALFLLAMAFAGVIGDPLNGALFDLFDSYRAMFLMMATYAALAFLVVLQSRRALITTPDIRAAFRRMPDSHARPATPASPEPRAPLTASAAQTP